MNSDLKKSIESAYKIRKDILDLTYKIGRGHLGGALSIADILAVLYESILRYRADEPNWPERDRFVLSKAHGCLALYSVLCQKKFFSRKILDTYMENGSILGQHPDKDKIIGVEISAGALGHGLSRAVGMAIALKLDKKYDQKVYVLLGDGECQKGTVWEAVMTASEFQLDNLIAIVDNNHFQLLDSLSNTNRFFEPIGNKFECFGWEARNIDGHDIHEIYKTFSKVPFVKGKPSCVVANTVKGKGLSIAENQVLWHYHDLKDDEYVNALNELDEKIQE